MEEGFFTRKSPYRPIDSSANIGYNEPIILCVNKKGSDCLDEIMIRFWQEPDIPDLQKIFTISFGDPPKIVEAFQRIFLTAPEVCTLAAISGEGRPEGRPVAAAYCLPGAALCSDGRRIESAYLYAFGCLPEWRGQGIMKRVYSAAFAESARQAPVSFICSAASLPT